MASAEKRDKGRKEKRSAAKRVQRWGQKVSEPAALTTTSEQQPPTTRPSSLTSFSVLASLCAQLGTSIINVGGSLRPLSSGGSSSSSPFGSPHASSSSSSSAASSYHPPRIDLPSTLSTFGSSTTPFNLSAYLSSQYSTASPALAVYHSAELRKRKEQTSEELRSYVTRHYPAFIESTKEILTIEGDMAQLTTMIGQFNAHLGHMASPSLAYNDERLFKRGREKERDAVASSERQLKEQLALEEWNEDLRQTIYERKFDKAVKLIEMTWKRWDKQEKTRAKDPHLHAKLTSARSVAHHLQLLLPVCPLARPSTSSASSLTPFSHDAAGVCCAVHRLAPPRWRWRTA